MIKVSVISPEKVLFEGTASSLVVPGSEGLFGVLPGHISMLSLLGIGVLKIESSDKGTIHAVIDGGFCEVNHNRVHILADGGVLQKDIDLEKEKSKLAKLESESPSVEREKSIKKAKTRIFLATN